MGEMTDLSATLQLRWKTTDPNRSIRLSQYKAYVDNYPEVIVSSYATFFSLLSQPDEYLHRKDGPSFLIGPCDGRRTGRNLKQGYIAVLDVDKSIDEDKQPINGGPPPLQVHEALKNWNISHCLYTTFSHGSDVGNRYRIVFPVEVGNPAQLKAFIVYMVELLQLHAQLPVALTRESYVWGQGWAYPRVRYADSEFLFYQHFGVVPDPGDLSELYAFNERQERMPEGRQGTVDPSSPLGMVDRCMPVQWQLEQHGYTFVSQGIMTDQDGKEVPVMRYRRPGSSSAPGTVVFFSRDRWRVYSHHGNDPLNNDRANDSMDVFRILNGFENETEALIQAIPVIQESIEEELNTQHPSVMEQGNLFRYGSGYTDDLGGFSYRFLDPTNFKSMLSNMPGVPILKTDSEGNKSLQMMPRFDYWTNCRRRVVYNGVSYVPCPVDKTPDLSLKKGDKVYFNAFRGWNLSPIKGNWPLLEWHLRYAICSGDEESYEYLLNWFAHLFRCPQEKPQVALVIQGGRGWGKTLLFSELARALGSHAFVAGNNRLLTGHFNQHLRNRLLLIVEESFWSGNHKDRGVLQHVITDPISGYEKKGVDPELGLSYLRVVMISNEDWVVPAATDERRYFLPTVSDVAFKEDLIREGEGKFKKGAFFPRLVEEMRGGGIQAFAYDMCHRSVSSADLRNVPVTEKLHEQMELSLDWVDKWFMMSLSQGAITSRTYSPALWTFAGCAVGQQELVESLREMAPQSSMFVDKSLLTKFGIRVKKIFGRGFAQKVKRAEGIVYSFMGIDEARTAFEKYVNFPVDWGQETIPPGGSLDEKRKHH